ncbi:TetR/AcrR family transcriptional regulator C-terminal domain-containing protein [Streptomyces sp. SID13031]|uniref:TetR/AcrR family transcriptional regulator n=1 Tax=Streptomyces sp. SID13031 TaxID=2706046 RepID=UPI0013CB7F43|nr:TetR/AcrR family transcriptional regulator C-terminal domain-containing protein [Streptomyces sp. SID13031]NEA30485.1 TetR family transcriptional regulator [Streptomyces sp. SID13031]
MPAVSRRDRPAKPALTREGIVDAAVRLMESEGLQRVTMRRLALELDTGAASLYVYVANSYELHAAILDRLLEQVELVPVESADDWREGLHRVLGSYTDILLAHPSLAHSALNTRPDGPHYLALVDTLLGLLAAGQVPAGQAAWGLDFLLQTATATAAEHSVPRNGASHEDELRQLSEHLAGASAEKFPYVHGQAADLVSGTPAERRRWAFDMLINGIIATARPAGGTGV